MGVLVAMVHDVEGLMWFTAIVVAAEHSRNILSGSIVRRVDDRFAGSLLLIFGVRIALSSDG